MSPLSETAATGPEMPEAAIGHWPLWRRQVEGVFRLEVRKNLFGGRAIPLLLLAALPLGLLILFSLAPMSQADRQAIDPAGIFAAVFRLYYLKIGIFLGCLVVFLQLFRGDVLDRSLHYYLLCPVRREILVAAKYVVGLAVTGSVLVASCAASFVVLHTGFGASLASGEVLGQLLRYSAITALGCAGYGAVFMLAGLFFRNPVVPAVALFLWELINPFVGALLKKLSVIHYLTSLLPVRTSFQALEILTPDISPWISIPGLLLVTGAAVFVAGRKLRRTEITYSED